MSKHILQKCEPTKSLSSPEQLLLSRACYMRTEPVSLRATETRLSRAVMFNRCLSMMPGTAKSMYYRVLLLPNIENDLKEGDVGEVNRRKPWSVQ